MKKPGLFFRHWNPKDSPADEPKLLLDWWSCRPGKRCGIDVGILQHRFEFTLTLDVEGYKKELGKWAGRRLL